MAHPKSGNRRTEAPVRKAASPEPRPQGRIVAGICAALILACAAIYGRTLSNDFVNYDDPLYVTENPAVQAGLSWAGVVWAFTTDRAMYMHPLTWMSHMADCDLYGLHPWGHHLTNLLFHTLDSVLLFLVFARMTRRLWPSAVVAALFAVHPLHVESVAWAAERKDVLSMLFWTASIGAYAWHRQRPGAVRYLAVAFLFILALLSKPMVVTLPFVLLLLDYWPLEQVNRTAPFGVMARRTAWLAAEKAPLFLITGIFCAITFMMQMRGNNLAFGGKVPLAARCANAAVVYVLYLAKTLWPSGLAVYYPHPIVRPLWQASGAALILSAITLFCLRRARRQPYLIVGWLWYLGTLVPVIELVQAGTFSHADRYTYIPLTGIFVMIAWGAADLAEAARVPGRAVAAASGIALVTLTAFAGVQAGYWHDSGALFGHAAAVGQESSVAYDGLAVFAANKGRQDQAVAYLKKALELKPDDFNALSDLGKLALDQGRHEEARICLAKALELKPDHVDALNNMGVLALDQGRYDEAKTCLAKALALRPDHVDALNNMAKLALAAGRNDEAAACFSRALALKPGHVDALYNLGVLAMQQGHHEEAKTYFGKALAVKPDNAKALNNLGWCLMDQGRYGEAQPYFRKAVETDPTFIKALNNLGFVLAKLGRRGEADGYLKRAAELSQAGMVKKK